MRWLAIACLVLGAACTKNVYIPVPVTPTTVAVVTAPPATAPPCPTGSMSVHIASLRWTASPQFAVPGLPPQPVTYNVSVSGEITNNTSSLVAILGPTINGRTQAAVGIFALTAITNDVVLLPGGSTRFSGQGTANAVPDHVTSVGTFIWQARPAQCGEPGVDLSGTLS